MLLDGNASVEDVVVPASLPACCTSAIDVAVPDETVNGWPLLATPPTVTTTLPLVALAGTGTTMLVADQLEGVAVVPLNVTVLVPLVAPKLIPTIVTEAPAIPLAGERLVTVGAAVVTVNVIALLATPATVTTTLPVVAPVGTGTTMLDADQLEGVAVVPWNVTVLVPLVAPKFVPVSVTDPPTAPLVGDRLVSVGAAAVIVNVCALLATPPTVTTTLPVVVPAGTGATMLDADQLVGAAVVPLNVTVLVPLVAPKLLPREIDTVVPTAPAVGERLEIVGVDPAGTVNGTSVECALSIPEGVVSAHDEVIRLSRPRPARRSW